jgi:hypothetical protein
MTTTDCVCLKCAEEMQTDQEHNKHCHGQCRFHPISMFEYCAPSSPAELAGGLHCGRCGNFIKLAEDAMIVCMDISVEHLDPEGNSVS